MSNTDRTAEKTIDCPKCAEPMRPLIAGKAKVDRCEKCYGIWLDKGERLKVLADKSLVTGLDVGSAEVGRQNDAITEIDCPRCRKRMKHITDRAQTHIGYEFCDSCEASFFDAGELRDMSEFTLAERIKAIFGHG